MKNNYLSLLFFLLSSQDKNRSIKYISSKKRIAPNPMDFIKDSVRLSTIIDVLIRIRVAIVSKVGIVEVSIKVFPEQMSLFFERSLPIK